MGKVGGGKGQTKNTQGSQKKGIGPDWFEVVFSAAKKDQVGITHTNKAGTNSGK